MPHLEIRQCCSRSVSPYLSSLVVLPTDFIGILIFTLRSILYLINQGLTSRDRAQKSDLARSSYLYLAFTLDYAIEFPLFVSYHPVTLVFPNNVATTLPLPTVSQMIAQLAIFFIIDWAFHFYVLRSFAVQTTKMDSNRSKSEDDEAWTLVIDFIRPRGALLLAVAFSGAPSPLNQYTGRLHVFAMVGWVILRQSDCLWGRKAL